jgi:predicted TIM-barrel fold metal-dependent hydrolase
MILDRVKSGLPLRDTLVIDCHGHLGRWPLTNMPRTSVEEMIETMDRLGVDKLCLSSFLACFCDFKRGNDVLAATVRQHPDRLIGQIVVNPNYPHEVLPELERWEGHPGMRMLKIHPLLHDYPVDGLGYREFWRYADEKELVVLSHTWESDQNCGPHQLAKIAREHPRVQIILAHAGGTQEGCGQAIEAVKEHDNLYLDTATSQLHVGMIERFVGEVGADRLLFGSDIPLLEPAAQLGRIAYAKIPEDQKEKILGLNMSRLLEDASCDARPET